MLVAAIVFVATAALYLWTMSRGVGFIDRGELAAVACTLGIAHPTGYPTLVLISHAFQAIVPGRPIVVLNALAVFLVAFGAAGLALLCDRFLESVAEGRIWKRSSPKSHATRRASRSDTPKPMRTAGPPLPAHWRAIYAGCAALLIATSTTFWQQANGFEVYAFQAFLLPLLGLALLRDLERPTFVSGLLFGLMVGITFTNHLTVIVLAPAFLVAWFVRLGLRDGLRRIVWPVAPAFLAGLLPYAWMMLRAAQEPRLSWGDPRDLERLLSHVTGRQYQLWMFSSGDMAQQQWNYAMARLPSDLGIAGVIVAVVGIFALVGRARGALIFAGLIIATSLVFVIGYGIRDVDPYALPALVGFGLLIAAGWTVVHRRFGAPIAVAAAITLIVFNAVWHFRACNERDLTMPEDLVRDLLEPLPEHAVLFSSLWDNVLAPSMYLQIVEGLRPDVTVISTELLRHPWYVRELARREPELMAPVRAEADRLEAATRDGLGAEAAYDALVGGMVAHAAPSRRIHATCEVDLVPLRALVATPCGLAVEFRADTSYVACSTAALRLRPWNGRADHYVATHHLIYGQSLVLRSNYEARHGFHDRALAAAQAAVACAPPFHASRIPALPADGTRIARDCVTFFERLRVSVNAGLPELR
jgi:Protein of unknown function (DUF2723)